MLGEPWLELHSGPRDAALIVAGVSDVELNGCLPSARRVQVRGLQPALRMRDPPFVLVLGDDALRRSSPSVIGPLLRRPGVRSLGLARATPAHLVAAWARSCPIEFVPEGRVVRRIAMACRLGGASAGVDSASDCGGHRERMRRALVALQGTQDFQVKSWAHALGKSRHALRRLCNAALGLSPEDIVWAFFDAKVRKELLHGRSDEEIAAAVDVAGAHELRRAYALRGVPYPRR
jgi:hypothetical protein